MSDHDEIGRGDRPGSNVITLAEWAVHRQHRPTKTSWRGMIDRAKNGKFEVDPRWTGPEGFERFLADMGPRLSKDHSLDRIDPKNPRYGPSLCRWATKTEQTRNRGNTIKLTVGGVTKTLAEWAEETGQKYATVYRRHKNGWFPGEVVHGRDRAKVQHDAVLLRLPYPVSDGNKLSWERRYRQEGLPGESRLEFFVRVVGRARMRVWEQLEPYRPMAPDHAPPEPPAELIRRWDLYNDRIDKALAMLAEERAQVEERRRRAEERRLMRDLQYEFGDQDDDDGDGGHERPGRDDDRNEADAGDNKEGRP